MSNVSRDRFSGSIGVFLATVGSAIGLGNIWKFPYITGHYGGSAFIIVYLICIAVVGLPLIMSEFLLGRRTSTDAVDPFRLLAPNSSKKWVINGWFTVLISFIIITFYSIISGWTLFYAVDSIIGGFDGLSPEQIGEKFGAYYTSSWQPVIWQIIFMIVTLYIIVKGIKNGIEKFSKFLMPLLFIIIIVLDVRSVTLKGASAGLDFLFSPDFSKLTIEGVLSALGHAFFTLSLGMAIMITYASYIKREVDLGPLVLKVAIADTVIALLAGVAIFPAVFAFGIEPASGPGLVFVTLPNVFNQMPLGRFFAFLFFFLLSTAALTSQISIIEPSVSFLINRFKFTRLKATLLMGTLATVFGAILTQGNGILKDLKVPFYLGGKFVDMNIFDWAITLTDQLLPIAGFFTAIFVGWIIDRSIIRDELTSYGTYRAGYYNLFVFVIRYITPTAIALIFISNTFGFFS